MKTPLLDAQTATVTTASIEIKALTINKRQVTLSVFRQLPRRRLLDDAYSYQGVPWGTVNYFWPECPERDGGITRLHVVWQQGESLYRALIGKQAMPYRKDFINSDEYKEFCEQVTLFNQAIEPLYALPQLFIAV